MYRLSRVVTALAVVGVIAACSNSHDSDSVTSEPMQPYADYQSEIYADADKWLCHDQLADSENVCASNLDTTVVHIDGSTEIERHVRASDPEVDCFYVYPTVSGDEGGNSDLDDGEEERFTTLNQAARYSSVCRVFAPVYRQTTIASIFSGAPGDSALAYGDVEDAFKHYIANHNNGRGFVLIGHSQGSGHLTRLVAEQVESEPFLMDRMIAAHLIGLGVRVPEGADVGGSFQSVPVCRTADQTGCVIHFSSFRDSDPFLAAGEAVFGTAGEGVQTVCANPAALSGGLASMDGYFPTEQIGLLALVIIKKADGPYTDPTAFPEITTPFYKMPGFFNGDCVLNSDGVSYLEITDNADPADPRADTYNGEFIGGDGWGLHLIDVSIAMGDLVRTASMQIDSWLEDQ